MKKAILFLLIASLYGFTEVFAQGSISGQVIDSESEEELRSKLYDLQDSGLLSTSGSALHSMQQEIMTSVIPAHYELWQYDDVGASDNEYIFFLFGRKGG